MIAKLIEAEIVTTNTLQLNWIIDWLQPRWGHT